jgi:hypothetical protein
MYPAGASGTCFLATFGHQTGFYQSRASVALASAKCQAFQLPERGDETKTINLFIFNNL